MKYKAIRNTAIMFALMMLVTLPGCYPYPYYPYDYGNSGGHSYRDDHHGHDGRWRGRHYRRHHDDD